MEDLQLNTLWYLRKVEGSKEGFAYITDLSVPENNAVVYCLFIRGYKIHFGSAHDNLKLNYLRDPNMLQDITKLQTPKGLKKFMEAAFRKLRGAKFHASSPDHMLSVLFALWAIEHENLVFSQLE